MSENEEKQRLQERLEQLLVQNARLGDAVAITKHPQYATALLAMNALEKMGYFNHRGAQIFNFYPKPETSTSFADSRDSQDESSGIQTVLTNIVVVEGNTFRVITHIN